MNNATQPPQVTLRLESPRKVAIDAKHIPGDSNVARLRFVRDMLLSALNSTGQYLDAAVDQAAADLDKRIKVVGDMPSEVLKRMGGQN